MDCSSITVSELYIQTELHSAIITCNLFIVNGPKFYFPQIESYVSKSYQKDILCTIKQQQMNHK